MLVRLLSLTYRYFWCPSILPVLLSILSAFVNAHTIEKEELNWVRTFELASVRRVVKNSNDPRGSVALAREPV